MQAIFRFGLNFLCDGHVIERAISIEIVLIINTFLCDGHVMELTFNSKAECNGYVTGISFCLKFLFDGYLIERLFAPKKVCNG